MNQGRFDGFAIDSYQGKFAGTFDIDLDDGTRLGLDNEVVIVLVARVKSAAVQETSTGDLKRINSLKPLEMKFVHNTERQRELREECGFMLPAPTLLDENLTAVDFSEADSVQLDGDEGFEPATTDSVTGVSYGGVAMTKVTEEDGEEVFSYPPTDRVRYSPTDRPTGNGLPVQRDKMLASFLEESV